MRWFVLCAIAVGCQSGPRPEPVPPPTAPPPAPAPVPAPATLDGYWTGVLNGQLRIALVVHGTTAILDSIDQSSKLPVDKLTFDGTNVHFDIPAVHGHYTGKLSGDTIDGMWSQGAPRPLVLTRSTPPAAGNEPKPHPPAPIDAPIDVWVPKLPAALHADGRTHLVYELHIDNYGSSPI